MNNRITTSLILILFFAVCISNLFVHKKLIDWNRNLQVILPEVRNSSFNFSSDFISNLDYNFPNLTQSALPIKAIIGAGLIRKDSTITEGLDLLYSSVSDNPYTGFPEAMLATYHQAMGNIDSLEYYTRKSHSILPNNPAHFILMSKMYVNQNKRDSILLLFEDIYKRVKKDPQVWKIFLAAVSSDANNLDTVKTKMYANEAKSLFKRTDMFLPDKWPSYFSRAKGCEIWDLDNRKYVDMSIMGIGTNSLGYGHHEVDKAVEKTISNGNMSTFSCPEEVILAEKLIEINPENIDFVSKLSEFYVNIMILFFDLLKIIVRSVHIAFFVQK